MRELRILSPIGALGYGINAESVEKAAERGLDLIGVDAGSTDAGAYYLGTALPYTSRTTTRRDIRIVLRTARRLKIPLLIGSAGCAGANPQVDWVVDIVREVAKEEDLHFKLAVIRAEQDKEFLKQRLRAGRVRPLTGVPSLTEERVDACVRLVAQMGVEPYQAALDAGAEVIIAGRSCDTAIFASYPIRAGYDRALSLHAGKIVECGALSALPPTGRDCIVASLRDDHFIIEAPNEERRVTPTSVAGHMVYESEHPFLQYEPTGRVDFSNVTMEPYNERATKISNTRFYPADRPSLRLEGAELVGYRSFVFGGIRDPYLIEKIDEFVEGCNQQVADVIGGEISYRVDWKLYGKNAVMGAMEPFPDDLPHELGVLVQVLADSQREAHDVAAVFEARMIGFAYSGARTRTAHIAFPFSPVIQDNGPVFRFGVLHIVELDSTEDLIRLFPIEYETL